MMMVLLIRAPPLGIDTPPHPHIRPRLRHQRIPNITPTPAHPLPKAAVVQREQRLATRLFHELGGRWRRLAHDDVEVHFDFLAVRVEG